MDTIITKLLDLAYEIFGVLLPGAVSVIFFVLWWLALGDMAPHWTHERVPHLTLRTLYWFSGKMPGGFAYTAGICLTVAAYFIGQVLNTISKQRLRAWVDVRTRIWNFLSFRVTYPAHPHSNQLDRLFNVAAAGLSSADAPLAWREFYPAARTFIQARYSHSLMATYQNKYTLHRTIGAAAAILFWATSLAMLAAAMSWAGERSRYPHWWLLLGLELGSLLFVAVFSESFAESWTLFGDAALTETFVLLVHPAGEPRNDAR